MQKLILADNQHVFRTGAARIFAIEEDLRIIGQCDDLPRFLKAISGSINAVALFASSLQPDLAAIVEVARVSGCQTIAVLENDENAQDYVRAGIRAVSAALAEARLMFKSVRPDK